MEVQVPCSTVVLAKASFPAVGTGVPSTLSVGRVHRTTRSAANEGAATNRRIRASSFMEVSRLKLEDLTGGPPGALDVDPLLMYRVWPSRSVVVPRRTTTGHAQAASAVSEAASASEEAREGLCSSSIWRKIASAGQ